MLYVAEENLAQQLKIVIHVLFIKYSAWLRNWNDLKK